VDATGYETGELHLTITPKDSTVSINQQLLRDGWARLVSAKKAERNIRKIINELKADEDMGKNGHYNIWEYGDVSDDEAEDVPAWREQGRPPTTAQQVELKKLQMEKAAKILEKKRQGGMK